MSRRDRSAVAGLAAELARRLASWRPSLSQPSTGDASNPRAATRTDAHLGEALAAAHLESLGYAVVARNLRIGHDEADLVVVVPPDRDADPPVLAIVEVKTTRALAAPPHLRIDAGKRRRLIRLAERLLARHELADAFLRFDAVGVDLARKPPRLEHLPGCFEATSPTGRGHRGSRRSE